MGLLLVAFKPREDDGCGETLWDTWEYNGFGDCGFCSTGAVSNAPYHKLFSGHSDIHVKEDCDILQSSSSALTSIRSSVPQGFPSMEAEVAISSASSSAKMLMATLEGVLLAPSCIAFAFDGP